MLPGSKGEQVSAEVRGPGASFAVGISEPDIQVASPGLGERVCAEQVLVHRKKEEAAKTELYKAPVK